MESRIRTHVANYLGKCRDCDNWLGAHLLADDDKICGESKYLCPIWCVKDNDEHLTKLYEVEED